MTVIVQYRDGSSETFTSVTDLDTSDPTTVEITGTDAGGNTATWWIPWDLIKKVGKIIP